jgi:hypothetical protein
VTSESAYTAAYSGPDDSARDAVNDLYGHAVTPVRFTLPDRLRAGLLELARGPHPEADGILDAVTAFAYGRPMTVEQYNTADQAFDDLVTAEAGLHQLAGGMVPAGLWDDDEKPADEWSAADRILADQRDTALAVLCGSRDDGPPRVGDKVVYCGPNDRPVWVARRTRPGICIDQDPSGYVVVYTPGEVDEWRGKPEAVRVVARAEYAQVTP